jgi:hypothetical protein
VKKGLSPQEKKRLAYDRDHYVSAGESRHAFRKEWPKKKAMLNQKYRHQVAQALHTMEKIGDLTRSRAARLKTVPSNSRRFIQKTNCLRWKEYVQESQEGRKSRARYATREREYMNARYNDLITSLEHSYKSPKGRELLSEIKAHGFILRLFLGRNPEWRPRLKAALFEFAHATKKAEGEQKRRHLEKERAKALHKAIHKRLKSEGLV